MENREDNKLPIEATEKAITAGKFGKDEINKAATKMGKQVQEVEIIKQNKTKEEAKKVVEDTVQTRENDKNDIEK